MSYLNKAQKEALISLGGVTSFCEELATTEWIKDEADKERLRKAHKLTMEVMENIESGMDEDQLRGILRFANNCVLMVMPKTNPNTDADLVIVDRKTVERIVDDSLNECFFCEKKGNQVRNCQRRRDLLECGAVGGGGECPYQI
ncbi:MAG: hypothetical protein J6W09_04305 [Bacteroidales bacterium]|nr:hypothetical protein [Bacteroidales bacterium]